VVHLCYLLFLKGSTVLPFSRVRGILDYASDFGNTSFVSEKKEMMIPSGQKCFDGVYHKVCAALLKL
jgi:hypothetical protein